MFPENFKIKSKYNHQRANNIDLINNSNQQSKNFLFQKPRRIQILSFFIFFTFISMLDLIYSSNEINNTSIISDIYMEHIIAKSSQDSNDNQNHKLIENKINRITFDEISNIEKSKKKREKALMNYYSEYISLIKDIADEDSDEKNEEEEALNKIINQNNFSEFKKLIGNPLQMTKDQIKCILSQNNCEYDLDITEDGKTLFKKKDQDKYNEMKTLSEEKNNIEANKISESKKTNSHKNNKNNINDKNNQFNIKQDKSNSNNYRKNSNKNQNTNYGINNHNDLYDEVVSEILNNKLNAKKIFEFSLKTLYGNSTLLYFTIEDLENLIKYSYITDGQAVLLWETLTMMKTDRLKNLNLQRVSESDNELYLFNLLPTKSIALFVLNSGVFVIGYNMLLSFNSKDRDRSAYLVNIIIISFALYSAENFYAWKYYLISTQMLILFICALKSFMDSIYVKLGFILEDNNIFGNYSKTKNNTQFILKFLILSTIILAIGIFTFSKFPHFYNYVLFYVCITQILNLISVFLQYEVIAIFQPFRHFVMIAFGLINFLIINFHKKNYFFSEWHSQRKMDSFYLIGDLYSIFCFFFLYDYLFTQANNISSLFYEKNLDNEKINMQISSIMKEYTEMSKNFTSEDSLWILGFFIGFLFQYVGLNSKKYLVFYFSLYYYKTLFSIFGRIYNIRYLRFIYNICLFLFLINNHIISNKNDEILFEVKHFYLFSNFFSI